MNKLRNVKRSVFNIEGTVDDKKVSLSNKCYVH
jgi:hypothetical protein